MQLIYNYLKSAWQNNLQEHKQYPAFIGFLLLGCTIPLSLAINNIVLIGTLLIALYYFKRADFKIPNYTLTLIFFFAWTACSYFWTIDPERTLIAIPKGLVLIALPFLLSIQKTSTQSIYQKILKYYSYVMVGYVLFSYIRACIRYVFTKNQDVFFYHELVTVDVNAIHATVFVAMAYFYFFQLKQKTKLSVGVTILLFSFILLLSSKMMISVIIMMSMVKIGYDAYQKRTLKILILPVLILLLSLFLFGSKLINRFSEENISKTNLFLPNGTRVVTLQEAWSSNVFTPNDYFSGTAFRVYQARVFCELFKEESLFWKGTGLNASYMLLDQKSKEHNIFRGNDIEKGYHTKNFHNQYIQVFAELGIVGFILLILMLGTSLRNAILYQNFMHLVFSILMISLFLTESFLWRQRGIVFFVYFYCLFNSNFTLKKSTE